MKEKAPSLKHKEADARESGGHWEAREQYPLSKEYLAFEVQALRIIASRSKLSMLDVIEQYSPTLHSYRWPGDTFIDFNALSDGEIVDKVYSFEMARSKEEGPRTYSEPGMRYGCFKYHHWDDIVDIHFANEESDETGPLSEEKIENRLQELKDLFAEVRKEFPDAKEVTGDSWLYNRESYRRLFPEGYLLSAEVNTSPERLSGSKLWGQFQDSRKGLRTSDARTFLKTLEELDELTPETIRTAFPYQALKLHGPIRDFYEKYSVSE